MPAYSGRNMIKSGPGGCAGVRKIEVVPTTPKSVIAARAGSPSTTDVRVSFIGDNPIRLSRTSSVTASSGGFCFPSPASSSPASAGAGSDESFVSVETATSSSRTSTGSSRGQANASRPRVVRNPAPQVERMSYIIAAGSKDCVAMVKAAPFVDMLACTDSSNNLFIIAGAISWAFDFFDVNHLPSLRLLTKGHCMWCFRCGESLELNTRSNMSAHATTKKHMAGIHARHHLLPTDDEVDSILDALDYIPQHDLFRKKCFQCAVAILRSWRVPQRGIRSLLGKKSKFRQFLALFQDDEAFSLDVPAAVDATVNELWERLLEPYRGQPFSLGIDESDIKACGGRSILQVHVYAAAAEKPMLASIVVNNAKANHKVLCDALLRVANYMGAEHLVGVAADNATVCAAAVRELQKTIPHVQLIKCLAHSVQLCLKRVLETWKPLTTFLQSMAVLTARSRSLARKRLANSFGLVCSEWNFCPTRWTSATKPLLNLLCPDTWKAVHNFVRELRKDPRGRDGGIDAALDDIAAFIHDPTNILRIVALKRVNSNVNAVIASASSNFPPAQLFTQVHSLESVLTRACNEPYSLVQAAVDDGQWKGLIELFQSIAAEEAGIAATPLPMATLSPLPSIAAPAAHGAKAQRRCAPASGARPKQTAATSTRHAPVRTESAPAGATKKVMSAGATVPALAAMRGPAEAPSAVVGAKRMQVGRPAAQRSTRQRVLTTASDCVAEADISAAENPLWAAVDTFVDGAVITVAEEIQEWGVKAMETFREHVVPMLPILRLRLAVYPFTTEYHDLLSALKSTDIMPMCADEMDALEGGWMAFRRTKLSSENSHVPPTHEGLQKFWSDHRSSYPTLYKLVQRILCLPVSSVAVERGFSIQTHVMRRLCGSPVLINSVVNEIFLQTFSGEYLESVFQHLINVVADPSRCLKRAPNGRIRLPAPPSPRTTAAELDSSFMSDIAYESD